MSLLDDFDSDYTIGYQATGPAFDDSYEQEELPHLPDAGYITPKIEEEKPMFKLEKVEWKPTPEQGGLKRFVVTNNKVAMATERAHILRLNLSSNTLEDLEMPRKEERIHKIFSDPTGHHIVVSSLDGNCYYLHSSTNRMKSLRQLKGIVIESIAWDRQNGNERSSGRILLGSSAGVLYEAVLDTAERHVKQVYDLNDRVPITGLEFQIFPSASKSDLPKYFIMLTTHIRYYQFVGSGVTFDDVFAPYNARPLTFTELLSETPYSELHFFAQPYHAMAKKFAWLNGAGIFHGKLVFGSQKDGDGCASDTSLIPLPFTPTSPVDPPLAMVLTEFHFLLLYQDRFQALSQLSLQVVHEELFSKRFAGTMRGMVRDATSGAIFVYSDICVWEVEVHNEDRFVWQLCLESGDYEAALKHAKNAAQRDQVLGAQADHFFEKQQYELAAKYYARTQRSFEAVALQFIHANHTDALKEFLLRKLESFRTTDAMQRTVIATWLVELFLGTLSSLRSGAPEGKLEVAVEAFRSFLEKYRDVLNRETTYNLIASHGRIEEMLFYAALVSDFNRVISFHIQNKDYQHALDVMSRQTDPEVFYKYSPTLMACAPYETVTTWRKATFLQPCRLIPALVRYNPANNPPGETKNQAIRYLESVVQGDNKDPAVHNYLLSLYAQIGDEQSLLTFLRQTSENPHYDLKYALRLCHQLNLDTACVYIYSAMGLYQEAVELALTVDVDLAKLNADKAQDDDTRKRLWQVVARHVVEKATAARDRRAAIAILNECDLLKIEDVLPFFPDFVLIDDFKDEICSCLEGYNKHIEDLKVEMDEATNNAELIRADIRQLRNRSGFVGAAQKCELCNTAVLTRQFYLFPCGHAMHADCLTLEMQKHLDPVQRRRVQEIHQRLSVDTRRKIDGAAPADEPGVEDLESEADALSAELDDYIAAECLFCGDAMIKTIDAPFITDADMAELKTWEI